MPAPSVDEHTEEFEQLAGLSALRVLEGEELQRFESHAASCERCQLMLRLDREALARVSLAAPEMDPSPDFKARLMARATQEISERERARQPVQLRPRPLNVVPFWRRTTSWAGALAAVFVLGLVSVGAFAYQNEPVAVVDLEGSGGGTARVVVRRSGAAELEMRGVPDAEPGFVYEAWVIPPGKQPVAGGVTNRGDGKMSLPSDPRGATVAVTRERSRVEAPTSQPFIAGEVST